MAVALRCESGCGRPYASRLRADARRLMSLLELSGCELSILIAGDEFVHALNRDFRGKDRPTDVLSFSQLEKTPSDGARHRGERRMAKRHDTLRDATAGQTALGDVVISVDTARRQARRLGVAPAARMRALLLHGLLHLLGYDHERSPAEARRMFARERELAAALRQHADSKLRVEPRASKPNAAAKLRRGKPATRRAGK